MGVALKSNSGMTLVEVLVALVVLLLVSLAMLQTALLSIENNMINVLRDEAVSVAEMRMNEARNIPFDTLAAAVGDNVQVVARPVRNIAAFPFTATRTVVVRDGNNLQVDVRVQWEWKDNTVANGNPYRHSISTIMRRP
jgi:prepilin-type N-terminal cleavage/methylation domain-containing protein